MTNQIQDVITFRQRDYAVVDVSSPGFLFQPMDYGLKPLSACTANYRGFYCEYKVSENQLCLSRCTIYLSQEEQQATKRGDGPLLMGTRPVTKVVKAYSGRIFNWYFGEHLYEDGYVIYENMAVPLLFTGGILIGRELISDFWMMPDASNYGEVWELTFQEGVLTDIADRREVMQKYRVIEMEYRNRSKDQKTRIDSIDLRNDLLDQYNRGLSSRYHRWQGS